MGPTKLTTPAQQPTPVPVPQSRSAQISTPAHSSCSICGPNQTGVNAAVKFNGRRTNCASAHGFMMMNYNQGSEHCISAQVVLSSTCCQNQANSPTSKHPSLSYFNASSLSIPSATERQTTRSRPANLSNSNAVNEPVTQVPSTTTCNICGSTQIEVNAAVSFSGRRTNCAAVCEFMAMNYNEGSENCIDTQMVLSNTCCQDEGNKSRDNQSTPLYPAPSNLLTASVAGKRLTRSQPTILSSPCAESEPVAHVASTSTCNICRPNRIGVNAAVSFSGKRTNCAVVHDFMTKNYNEGSKKCIGAQAALSSICCEDQGNR